MQHEAVQSGLYATGSTQWGLQGQHTTSDRADEVVCACTQGPGSALSDQAVHSGTKAVHALQTSTQLLAHIKLVADSCCYCLGYVLSKVGRGLQERLEREIWLKAKKMQRQVASDMRLTDGHRCTGAFTCTMPGPLRCCCPTASLPLLSFMLLLEEYLTRCGLVLAVDVEAWVLHGGGVSALGVEDCDWKPAG